MTRSYYAMHLNNWLDYFDEKSIFITTDLELQANSRKVFSRIEDFLGVDKHMAKLHTKFLPNEVIPNIRIIEISLKLSGI